MKKLSFLAIALLVSISVGSISYAQEAIPKQAEINSGFDWYTLKDAQQLAAKNDKKILLFGYADWCTYCLKMRKESFPDPAVIASIEEHYYPVQINGQSAEEVEYNGQKLKSYELAQFLGISSYPTHYFIDAEGKILGAQPGYIEPDIYALILDFVGTDAYGEMDFDEYLEKNDTK
ncbi:MAG TPA: hypothetical protein DEQ34_09100 [Balneolaceae bacterium]|nr:hypothetical protein [Balneolaceae bacterium]|tara:strand:+ start:9484 stop:10011 length:528 start_codon:yes stop_codon:yes gene_type:complete